MERLEALERRELDAYLARTPASRALYARATRVMPGGDTRTGTFHRPYPLFIARGQGARLWDADGHEYLDLLNNFTSLVHGHAHSAVVAALARQEAHSTAHGTANALQVELAEAICGRVPSVERLRFCNSGTEATLGALRAARAFTGKPRVMKMAGGYHAVAPDLTTFGKIIGGGLPVGAFGGRADVMATHDPTRRGTCSHSGTFNGNAITMAAGLATLARYDHTAVAALNTAGDAFRARLNGLVHAAGVEAVVVGYGSLMQVHVRGEGPGTPEAAADGDGRAVL